MKTLSIQRPRPSMDTRTPALMRTSVNRGLVNWLPCSVLKIVGRPNQKWVADFTYTWTAEGWLYVATVVELCSRRVVGWR